MEPIYNVLLLIVQNTLGIIIAIVIYIQMKNKAKAEYRRGYYEGRNSCTQDFPQANTHLEKMNTDLQKRIDNLSSETNCAYRCGIIKGVAYERNVNPEDLNHNEIYDIISSLSDYNSLFCRPNDSLITNDDSIYDCYEEIKFERMFSDD